MTYHAVRRINGLIGSATWQACNGQPQGWRKALNGGTRDAGGIKPFRVAADDMGDRSAPRFEPPALQGGGNIGDVPVQASLS